MEDILKNDRINVENPSFSSINHTSKNKMYTIKNLEHGGIQNLDSFDINRNNKMRPLKSAANKDSKRQ